MSPQHILGEVGDRVMSCKSLDSKDRLVAFAYFPSLLEVLAQAVADKVIGLCVASSLLVFL